MSEVISGKELSKKIKLELKEEVLDLEKKYNRTPSLTVILVGCDPASASYVRGKKKACDLVGIKNDTINLSDTTSESKLLNLINILNEDESVDGILVQLPLPKHISEDKVINAISPDKDVDGFHPMNVASLWLNKDCTLPCTPMGVITMLDSINYDLTGVNAVIVGRSNIVGLPLASLLIRRNATVTVCHSKTQDLASITSKADLLIAAIGKPKFITSEFVKNGACVIDVGVSRDQNNKLSGDVDYDNVFDKTSYITPVPGGVGPMTICSLMQNTIKLYKKHMGE